MEKEISSDFLPNQDPNGVTIHENDPGLYYYEFVILLARIALEVVKDTEGVEIKSNTGVVEYFFEEMMGFKLIDLMMENKVNLENVTKTSAKRVVKFLKGRQQKTYEKDEEEPYRDEIEDKWEEANKKIIENLESHPRYSEVEDYVLQVINDLPKLPPPPD